MHLNKDRILLHPYYTLLIEEIKQIIKKDFI